MQWMYFCCVKSQSDKTKTTLIMNIEDAIDKIEKSIDSLSKMVKSLVQKLKNK